jgi:hypothetical protein
MVVRAAIALSLAAAAWTVSVRAEDDPACAQYREPMAYNACLARRGPKANGVGTLSGHFQPGRTRSDWTRGRAPSVSGAQRTYRFDGRMHMEFRVQ